MREVRGYVFRMLRQSAKDKALLFNFDHALTRHSSQSLTMYYDGNYDEDSDLTELSDEEPEDQLPPTTTSTRPAVTKKNNAEMISPRLSIPRSAMFGTDSLHGTVFSFIF